MSHVRTDTGLHDVGCSYVTYWSPKLHFICRSYNVRVVKFQYSFKITTTHMVRSLLLRCNLTTNITVHTFEANLLIKRFRTAKVS